MFVLPPMIQTQASYPDPSAITNAASNLIAPNDFNLWTQNGVSTINANDASPVGDNLADTITENSASGLHRVQSPGVGGFSAGPTVIVECCAKRAVGSRDFYIVALGTGAGTHYANAYFDMDTLALISSGGVGATVLSASIYPVGDGFYFEGQMEVDFDSATTIAVMAGLCQGAVNNYQGDGSSAMHLYGMVLRQ